jgi:hypothetical protein
MFDKMDLDKNGRLSSEEFAMAMSKLDSGETQDVQDNMKLILKKQKELKKEGSLKCFTLRICELSSGLLNAISEPRKSCRRYVQKAA